MHGKTNSAPDVDRLAVQEMVTSLHVTLLIAHMSTITPVQTHHPNPLQTNGYALSVYNISHLSMLQPYIIDPLQPPSE